MTNLIHHSKPVPNQAASRAGNSLRVPRKRQVLTGEASPRNAGRRQILAFNAFNGPEVESKVTMVCTKNRRLFPANVIRPYRRKIPLQPFTYKATTREEVQKQRQFALSVDQIITRYFGDTLTMIADRCQVHNHILRAAPESVKLVFGRTSPYLSWTDLPHHVETTGVSTYFP